MYKILVVDDQPAFRETLDGFLSDFGYTVHTAGNERDALAAFIQETFDFALTDLRLHEEGEEDESGLSLAMALQALKPTRIIILSRYAMPKQTLRAVRYHGVIGFIDKNTQDWGEQVLRTIVEAGKEIGLPRFEKLGNTTRLNLSLAADQPLMIRAHGRHVCSLCTAKKLQVSIERYARKTEIARHDPGNLRFHINEIGCGLWHDLFIEHPEAERAYVEARAKSQAFSLLFETPREFLRLPLEFMRSEDPPEYLVLQHPLARFLYNATPKRDLISPSMLALTQKLRILIIASNTQPPIDGVDAEVQELHQYLKRQDCIPVSVKLIPTERATYKRVRSELRKRSYDIVHYAGHGSYRTESPEESSLYFWAEENKQGGIVPMKATELKMLLERSEARLVYMSSCYGTASDTQVALLDDDFLGLADAVAQAGVPSVLGFRWPVSDDGARRLALAFYQSLLEQGGPEFALWSARRELAAVDRNDPTWLSPILIHQE